MSKTLSDHLLSTLEELVPYDFEKFKFKLQNTSLEKEHPRIPRGHLQMAGPVKLATLMLTHYGENDAVQLTLQVLRATNQRLLAEELHKATSQDCLARGSGTDSSPGASSEESRAKSLKVLEDPEGDRQRKGSAGTSSLPPTQPEAGRGAQKKSQGRRRDQKGPEALDVQGKPSARTAELFPRRSQVPAQLPGDRERKASATLRRNASSTGRLQGLSCGSLGRREPKRHEVVLPSGKRRPKSLEFTTSGEPPNPESLLVPLEKMTIEDPASAAPRGAAAVHGGATVSQEKGSRSPEQSVIKSEETFGNTLSNAPLAREEKSTASGEKNGIGDPETPETLGKLAGSVLLKFSNPGTLSTSGSSQDTQEGDLPGGTCVHDAGHRLDDPGALEAAGRLASCPQCQASQAQKGSGGLSPEPQPQCQRHRKQVQLLFCEDHGEPICLICRLSQEHRGHWVRPIEEAALEYREQIQKQLEHLKELRNSGEEQRSQGDKETASLLKQTKTQRQRVRGQLEQLCQLLEQQEQLFVMWLEELDQTIVGAREAFSTRTSRDLTVLHGLIGELEAKQGQPEWELLQDIGVTLRRAKAVTAPEPWATPAEVKEKIRLLYQKAAFVEKSMQHFSETLCSVMKTFKVPELNDAQAHATAVTLDPATAHPSLIFSDDMRSVKLGNKADRLPCSSERFNSCIITLGSPSFISGRHYWEVEVGDKTAWVLGLCKASVSRTGSMTLSPENGYWVVMMTKRNEYQASTFPPTRLHVREPPKRVGVFLDWNTRDISFYNVTARSHIYTFTDFSSSVPLQPIFGPGTHDGGKNMGPLTICPVGGQGPR